MSKPFLASVLLSAFCLFAANGYCGAGKSEKTDGKKEFEKHCAMCHPDGGNVINSMKTLSRKVLQENGVKSAKDIIGKMRRPGPGMTTFDEKTVSKDQAKAIAEYILKTFK